MQNATPTAQEKLASGEGSLAAVAVRAAEESLHQTNVLLDAIAKVSGSLDEARNGLEAAVVDTSQDLAQAKAMIQSGAHPELAGPVAGVEAALAQVKAEIQGGKIDPIATLERVETAHQALDQSLTGIRDQQEQARRAQASLQQTIMSAQAQISATSDYITARRGGVGTEARTRLAEAQRNLDYALSISRNDPVTALTYAQQAHALAAQAAQLAQSDVDSFGGTPTRAMAGGGGMFGGGGAAAASAAPSWAASSSTPSSTAAAAAAGAAATATAAAGAAATAAAAATSAAATSAAATPAASSRPKTQRRPVHRRPAGRSGTSTVH